MSTAGIACVCAIVIFRHDAPDSLDVSVVSPPGAMRAVRAWRVCTCTHTDIKLLDISALPYLPVMSAVSSNANTS